MTIYEAASWGLPVVMYDLPNISFVSETSFSERGFITVNQPHFLYPSKARIKMADIIITVLKDRTLWDSLSEKQHQSFKKFSHHNVAQNWISVIRRTGSDSDEIKANKRGMISHLLTSLLIGNHRFGQVVGNNSVEKFKQKSLQATDWQRRQSQDSLFWAHFYLKQAEDELNRKKVRLQETEDRLTQSEKAKSAVEAELKSWQNSKLGRLRNLALKLKFWKK
jgi:hypothetical protein